MRLVKLLARRLGPAGVRRAERVEELTKLLLETRAVIEPGAAWSDPAYVFDPDRGASGRPAPLSVSGTGPPSTVHGRERPPASLVLDMSSYEIEVRGREFVIVDHNHMGSTVRTFSLPIAAGGPLSVAGSGRVPRAVAELVWFGDQRSGFRSLLFLDARGFRLAELPDFRVRPQQVFPLAAAAGVRCVAYQIWFPTWGYKQVLKLMFPLR